MKILLHWAFPEVGVWSGICTGGFGQIPFKIDKTNTLTDI